TVSVGDTIHWGTYPAIPDGSASGTGGTFLSSDSTITAVHQADGTAIFVDIANGSVFFQSTPHLEELIGNGFLGTSIHLVDSIDFLAIDDKILSDPTVDGPGLPNTSLVTTVLQAGDQGFLDIFIA